MKAVTFGEIMMRLNPEGYLRFVQANSFEVSYAGGEANVAVSLANYGVDAAFVSKVPAHEIGQCVVNELRRYGVDTKYLLRGGPRLGVYYCEKGASQRASKVIYDRAGSSIATAKAEEFDWDSIFEGADWFHWTGITPALGGEMPEACLQACKAAKEKGGTVSCDLNFRKKLWNYGCTAAEVMQPLVQYSDVIFGAEPEYQEILGIQPVGFRAVDTADVSFESDLPSFEKFGQEVERLVPRCQKVFLELRNSITSNHNVLAAVLYSDGTLKHTGIYDIEHETDRVGAGDAFVGGMIYGLITYPDDDRKALDFALAASALKNTVYGDFNLVTVDEVESLMNGNTSGRVSR